MAQDKFRRAEQEYFLLRGQFDTGRLSQEQFDEKLRELMQQDAQGRYWMLGADSAKWYYYDGTKWVQSDPYSNVAAPVPATPAASTAPARGASPAPAVSTSPQASSVAAAPDAQSRDGRGLPIVPILLVLLVLVLGAVAFLLYQNRDRLFVAQAPNQITPVLPPTITRAPSPTALSGLPTQPEPTSPATTSPALTLAPTLAPLPTAVPTVTPLALTTVATTLPVPTAGLPTLFPSATVATTAPTLSPTLFPVTTTPAPPTNTPLPNFPPNVYVTKIEYSSPAKRNQNVTFTANFLNTTGNASHYDWLVLLYDPEKTGNNKGFGESPAVGVSVPPGESKFSVTYSPVNGPGGCKSLFMRAAYKVSAFDKPLFPNTNGEPLTVFFDVCP